MDSGKRQDSNSGLGKVDHTRRAYLRKLAAGAAFAVPLVASFSTEGLRFNAAHALTEPGNMTGGGGILARIIRFILSFFERSKPV